MRKRLHKWAQVALLIRETKSAGIPASNLLDPASLQMLQRYVRVMGVQFAAQFMASPSFCQE